MAAQKGPCDEVALEALPVSTTKVVPSTEITSTTAKVASTTGTSSTPIVLLPILVACRIEPGLSEARY